MDIHEYFSSVATPSRSWMSRTSDLMLAALVVAIIALMILPLPIILLDVLVALNISLGVMLVLMGIYVSKPLQFSAFPSVLLISTLFRLALSVATTRMILLHADAGNIIDTFGTLVAGNNIVVGLVVFLIVTLVQFLVIAKGAERVAEVGARFTLDAMPGKQMSIDSDLRSGLIDKTEARRKRQELELESKLHGSMDGAMKFVKGDAIAGIVIIIINLLGGLTIGIFQRGMEAGAAMSKYSILTIGDGMVAQIPALLSAMAAGLIVTRVTDTDNEEHLGNAIQSQFAAIPRVLIVCGVVCVLMSVVPGFPTGVFIGLGILFVTIGCSLIPAVRKRMDSVSQPAMDTMFSRQDNAEPKASETELVEVQQSVPLLIELPAEYGSRGRDKLLLENLNEEFEKIQTRIGFPLPCIRFHWHRKSNSDWSFEMYEVPVLKETLEPDTPIDHICDSVQHSLRRHLSMFLGIQETGTLLTQTSVDYPDIVKEVLRSIPLQNVAAILRNLVEEEVSIRNVRGILEALIPAAAHEKDINNLTEFVRIALSRQICHQHSPDRTLKALALEPGLEEQLLESIRSGAGNSQLSLDPAKAEALRLSLKDAITTHRPDAIVTHLQIRRQLRQMVQAVSFVTPVLSYNELMGDIDLKVVQHISLNDHRMSEPELPDAELPAPQLETA